MTHESRRVANCLVMTLMAGVFADFDIYDVHGALSIKASFETTLEQESVEVWCFEYGLAELFRFSHAVIDVALYAIVDNDIKKRVGIWQLKVEEANGIAKIDDHWRIRGGQLTFAHGI